ncbi:MAG: VOC family protein [Chitinispirillaceae bacterium]|nr:VOC family protein [Chitinispirillaceae bacterium]
MKSSLRFNPYLNFDGNTEDAFHFYQSVFGGEFSSVQRFKDMPASDRPIPEKEAGRIMHIALPIGNGTILMGSDISESMGQTLVEGNNVYLSLHPDTLEEAQRLFKELSSDGNVEMPLEKMFWGDWFASFADKFGIRWMVNYEEKKEQ